MISWLLRRERARAGLHAQPSCEPKGVSPHWYSLPIGRPRLFERIKCSFVDLDGTTHPERIYSGQSMTIVNSHKTPMLRVSLDSDGNLTIFQLTPMLELDEMTKRWAAKHAG